MASPLPPLLSLLIFLFLLSAAAATPLRLRLTTTSLSSTLHPHQILNNLASHSISRAHQLKSPKTNFSSIVTTPLYSRSYGGYSISLSFGTPPQSTRFVMDTGSSLVWFPCTSRYICSSCNFPNVDPAKIPSFIPKLSSSSRIIGCKNPKCALVFGPNVSSKCPDCGQNCTQACPPYAIQYGLGSTAGILLSETLDFPDRTVEDFLVGCSIISSRQPEGIAGFGRSPESLPSQMNLNKFSYCLVSRKFDDTPTSSDLILQTAPGFKTRGLKYTPFQQNPNASNSAFQDYYYVALKKILVGVKQVKIPHTFLAPGSDGNGGTIVDSGSTFTFMESQVFELVAKEFETQMANFIVAREIENRTGLRPCFNISDATDSAVVPDLVFKFKGGAKMELPLANYFAFVAPDVVCLTIVSDSKVGSEIRGGPAIILGNFQQQNYFIEYDLEKNRFGFKRQKCV